MKFVYYKKIEINYYYKKIEFNFYYKKIEFNKLILNQ